MDEPLEMCDTCAGTGGHAGDCADCRGQGTRPPPKKRVYRYTEKTADGAVAGQFVDDDGAGVLAQLEAACKALRAGEPVDLNFTVETGEMTQAEFDALPEFE
jgi:DnaJ-class molecular chaperone